MGAFLWKQFHLSGPSAGFPAFFVMFHALVFHASPVIYARRRGATEFFPAKNGVRGFHYSLAAGFCPDRNAKNQWEERRWEVERRIGWRCFATM